MKAQNEARRELRWTTQAGQPTRGRFIFLGDALPQAGHFTAVLLCVHQEVFSFCNLAHDTRSSSMCNTREGKPPSET